MPDFTPFSAAAFPAFFVAVWVFALFLTAAMGGWRALAGRYGAPAARSGEGETFRSASASIGRGWLPANYKGCLILNLGRAGIYLSLWFPFRAFHPPLLIPWRAVRRAEREKSWWRNCTKVEVADYDGFIRIYGRAGESVAAAFAKFRP